MAKKNVKILIVDDHPILRDGIKTMLEMGDFEAHSFEVSEAGNGIEMSEQLNRKEFDIVIMDYKLEETDGPTLTKKALEAHPGLRVLALSNYGDVDYAANMLEAGAKGYVLKSVGTAELVASITTVLEGKLCYTQSLANELIEKKILGIGAADLKNDNPAVARLSKREIEIIQLICDQLTNEQISKQLFLSKRTIDNHRQNILNKLGMNNTAGLVRFAVENGLVL
jgi:DNA-binding NarL/FixJ family response regulator